MDLPLGPEKLAKMMGMSVQQIEEEFKSSWIGVVVSNIMELRLIGDICGLGSKSLSGPQYFPRLPNRVVEDDTWRDRGMQLVSAWFKNHWKSQILSAKDRDNNNPLFESMLETTSWNFNE